MKKNSYEKIYSSQKALDYAIRDEEMKNNMYGCGYMVRNTTYWNYMSNESWNLFFNSMSSIHKTQYDNADGGELSEKNSRYGMMPPKMASFGSSSRLIYNLSKSIPNFQFEKQLPTHVGHKANLDGYLCKAGKNIYVEAKCREIYSSHTDIEVGNVYEEVYNFIHEVNNDFSFEKNVSKEKNHFKCTFSYQGRVIKHFDIKQLICHFLAITADVLKTGQKANIQFLYLIFNPEYDTDFTFDANCKYKRMISECYSETIKEIENLGNLKWLFDVILSFQNGRKKTDYPDFTFKVVDQKTYQELLKS